MKRRTFFKSAGIVTVGAAFANNTFANIILNQKSTAKTFPESELRNALEQFFNKYFQGEMFDPSVKLPEGKLFLAKSFSIKTLSEKNTIFDIADLVIERCKEAGFDASSLKEGLIPYQMKVKSGGIIIEDGLSVKMIKFEELKNYDAIMIAENPIYIKTELPPYTWGDIKKIEKNTDTDYLELYIGDRNEITIKKSRVNSEVKLVVSSLYPDLTFAPDHKFVPSISSEIGLSFFNAKSRELLLNN